MSSQLAHAFARGEVQGNHKPRIESYALQHEDRCHEKKAMRIET